MTKKRIALLSFLILWLIEAIRTDSIVYALGTTIGFATIGVIVGGLVLFNVFLFFYNILHPKNKLSFDGYDKVIAGLWSVIIVGIFNFI